MAETVKDNTVKVIVIDDNEQIHDDFNNILSANSEVKEKEIDSLANSLFGDDESSDKSDAYDVVCDLAFASQGKQGYEMIKKAYEDGDRFDLAFVDMRMPPGWDGLETAERILEVDNKIQIVFCTAYSDYTVEDINQRVGSKGKVGIIGKPFDIKGVREITLSLKNGDDSLLSSCLTDVSEK